MRFAFTFGLFLSVLPVFSAPTPDFSKDPVSVHKRSEPPSEDSCMEICGLHNIQGALNERDALCSEAGLQNTLECALCIDTTWDETSYEDSAMAEYERIVEACQQSSQSVFRSDRDM